MADVYRTANMGESPDSTAGRNSGSPDRYFGASYDTAPDDSFLGGDGNTRVGDTSCSPEIATGRASKIMGTGYSFMEGGSDPSMPSPLPGPQKPLDGGGDDPATSHEDQQTHPMLRAYYYGQLAQTASFGNSGVGQVRIAYNLAICLISPIAGGFAQSANVKSTLVWTSILRALTYFVALPALWILFRSGWWGFPEQIDPSNLFTGIFLAVVFVDGCNVALLNVVAIDNGGPDLLSMQHEIEITDKDRSEFMSGHYLIMDIGMMILAPGMAVLGVYFGEHYASTSNLEPAILLACLGVSFFLLYGTALYFYLTAIPNLRDNSNLTKSQEEAAKEKEGCCSLFSTICQGLSLVMASRPIACRLLFFALEISLEDAMVALVCAEYGMLVMAPTNSLHGNFWANVLIGCSKVGGVITGCYMNKVWSEQKPEDKSYIPLFVCCALGGLSALAVPAATEYWGLGPSSSDTIYRDLCVFGGIFLFFLFTTAPKVGFGVLTQELIGDSESAGLIWGFAGAFITITDSLVIFAFSLLFEPQVMTLQNALWYTCGVFAFIGVFEAVFGPSLFLPEEAKLRPRRESQEALLP